MRPDFLKKMSKIASYDWASKGFPISKEHFGDGNSWNSVNLSGRREGPLYVEEPNFVLVKEEPHAELLGIKQWLHSIVKLINVLRIIPCFQVIHILKTLTILRWMLAIRNSILYQHTLTCHFYFADAFYRDDPFIPQRGRKSGNKSKFGMPTQTDRNIIQKQQVNTVTMTHQVEQSKKSALPIYDICCQQGLSSSTGMSKLCFVRCYSKGLKMDMKDIDNYDFMMPQDLETI